MMRAPAKESFGFAEGSGQRSWRGCAERSRSRNTGLGEERVEDSGSRVALAMRAPDSTNSFSKPNTMGHYNLSYSISKRTPASPKALKEILDAQTAVNDACTWSHERLGLAASREMGRAVLTFPLRFGFASGPTTIHPEGLGAATPPFSADAFAQGSTRVRDNLWNAHLVAAFLKHVSRMHPALLFELRDEGGFVVPGSVWIKGGNVEANREYLNRERSRALEVTGDPQAAAPFVWAELQGLGGSFFIDAAATDYIAVPEIRELGIHWDQLGETNLADIASHVVDRVTKAAAAPVVA